MGIPKTVKYFFAIVGLIVLTGSFIVSMNRYAFVKASIKTEGEVVELVSVRSSSTTSSSTTYAPCICFFDEHGRLVEFVSSISSSPASYDVGERVEIIYDPEAPEEARVNGFFHIWGLASVSGLFGAIFFTIGFLLIYSEKRKQYIEKYLKRNGLRITPDYLWTELNESYSVNDKHPYQIMALWTNPSDSEEHLFVSENIWFDPSHFIGKENITVLIDIKNPKRYFVDLPFLEKEKNVPE
ncbi:DUF3592 domain-containing protein [Marinifilum breve]|uniref:DUF3592 domain-containing protein n=1 Tax=Marinifilum breve TaxID=2184082 RepID=A0A2V4A6B7_9BACT|nr:DUF3592 domain-containing protein [Marinifilum breve]PXY02920.1 DUF3592 domain-containing protein [Marinifilum breve]